MSTTQAGYSTAPVYDSHGGLIAAGGDSYFYDVAGRHLATSQGTTRVEYQRDMTGRVVDRKTFDTTGGGSTVTGEQQYVSTGNGDTPDMVFDGSGTLIERTITLPGGAILTDRPAGTDVWSYPNIHGDIAATWTAGVITTSTYDPYGNSLAALPDDSNGAYDWAWLGSLQRGTEHQTGINTVIELGARPYNPTLARFNTLDPITGGNNNNYTYPNDPINQTDPNGLKCGGFFSFACTGWDNTGGKAATAIADLGPSLGFCVAACISLGYTRESGLYGVVGGGVARSFPGLQFGSSPRCGQADTRMFADMGLGSLSIGISATRRYQSTDRWTIGASPAFGPGASRRLTGQRSNLTAGAGIVAERTFCAH